MKKIYLALFLVSLCMTDSFSQCATPATVPYNESFYSVTNTNQLPPCMAISDPTTCLTYTYSGRTGQSCAVFTYNPAQTSYFYSEAIQLSAGITYSASAWYKTSFNNSSNNAVTWTDFSILMGTSQTTTGLVQISSTNGSAENIIYTPIGGTFTVASGGVYYFAISATSNGTSGTSRLFWDDLDVQVACNVSPNMPTITVVASPSALCVGQVCTLTATGAETYTWNTGEFSWVPGPTVPTVTFTANENAGMPYHSIAGTSTLSGCSATLNMFYVNIFPSPNIIVTASRTNICVGETVILSANGTPSYSWSTGVMSPSITVTPASSTTYTVVGTNQFGCTKSVEYSMIVDQCTGLKTNLLSGFKIYPNPGNGIYTLESGTTQLKSFIITDISGRVILTGDTIQENFKLDLKKFPAGIYYANINFSGEKFSLKLIKE